MGKLLKECATSHVFGNIINETAGTDYDTTARIRKVQSTFSMLMPVWKEKMYQIANKAQNF